MPMRQDQSYMKYMQTNNSYFVHIYNDLSDISGPIFGRMYSSVVIGFVAD